MNAELYYLVGKPNSLKQALVSVLRKSLTGQSDIIIPKVYTTDKVAAEGDNYSYIDERNFLLRQSMDLYGLSWEKKGHFYGVNGDFSQRLESGVDIILNGSLLNFEQAKKLCPNMNTIVVRKQKSDGDNDRCEYLIAENDEVKLEWECQDTKFGHPYVLTLMSDQCMGNAIEMILSLVIYNRNCLEYAG